MNGLTATIRNGDNTPVRIIRRFGDGQAFLKKANPDTQAQFALHPDKAVTGDYPTLADINGAYGRNFAATWLVPQLADLSLFTGARNLSEKQQEMLARMIASEFRQLKVTELMLFFHRFKAGHYGRFYGNVDPMVVTTALNDFLKERDEIQMVVADNEAESWRQYITEAWPKCAEELYTTLGLTSADIWLYVIEPHTHTVRFNIGTPEILQRIESEEVNDVFLDIVRRNLGRETNFYSHKTWFEQTNK